MHGVGRLLAFSPWIVFGLVWLAGAPLSKRSVRRESFVQALSYRLPLVVGCIAIFAGWPRRLAWFGGRLWRGSTPLAIGFVLSAAGIAFAIWARLTLGRLWSGSVTLKQGHHLVRSGPYRLARHPIYTGILCAMLGDAVIAATLVAFIGLATVVVAFVIKSGIEERFLEDQFGDELRDYRARVKRLIPFVWLL